MNGTADVPAAIALHPHGFGIQDIVRLSGATGRQVDYWDRTNVVWPSIHEATGTGSKRCWSFDDVVACSVLAQMSAAFDGGWTFDKFRNKALPMGIHLQVDTYGDWAVWLLLVDGEPKLVPSADGAVARLIEEQAIHPTAVFGLIDVGAHARRIAKEILAHGEATV